MVLTVNRPIGPNDAGIPEDRICEVIIPLNSLVQIKPGDEVKCDRAKLTEDAVLVRCHGVWTEIRPPLHDPFTERLIKLGIQADKNHAAWAIDNCNCMIRYNGGPQMPAIRKGKQFFTPEGESIATPTSHEDMERREIARLMKERGEVYIGNIFASKT
jgi:hypothetical protein